MGILKVRCPETGREVSTGIEIDPQSFASLPDKLTLSTCPFCGLDHVWLKCDARFVEEQIPKLPGDGVSVAAKEMTGLRGRWKWVFSGPF